jgi:hypothetical protein
LQGLKFLPTQVLQTKESRAAAAAAATSLTFDHLGYKLIPDVMDDPIFMIQNVPAETDPSQSLFVFYDSGCSTAVLSDRAHYLLETVTVTQGPTYIDVAGGRTVKVEHGDERFHIELEEHNTKATITGLRMPHVTTPFPVMKLMEAWEDAQAHANKERPKISLPTVDKEIGGCETDILLGIKYIRYFPKLVYTLPSGLQVYRGVFKSASGNQAVLGGPHAAWTRMMEVSNHMNPRAYLTSEARAWYMGEKWIELNQGKLSSLGKYQVEDPVEEAALSASAALQVAACTVGARTILLTTQEFTLLQERRSHFGKLKI